MFSLLSKFHPRKATFLTLICVFLALTIRPLFAASIVLPDGSTFDVELVSHGAGSYAYQVSEVSGKDLSHWLLEFGLCAGHCSANSYWHTAAAHCYQSAPSNGDCGADGDAGRTDRPAG